MSINNYCDSTVSEHSVHFNKGSSNVLLKEGLVFVWVSDAVPTGHLTDLCVLRGQGCGEKVWKRVTYQSL
jgi:hypothetical protein